MEVRRGRILGSLQLEPLKFSDGWDTGCERQRGVTEDDPIDFSLSTWEEGVAMHRKNRWGRRISRSVWDCEA